MAEVVERRGEAVAPAPELVIERDWRLTWLRIKEQGFFVALVFPAVVLTSIFLLYPIFLMLQLSFGDDDYVGNVRPTVVNYNFSTIDQYDRAITGTYVNVFDEISEGQLDGINRDLRVTQRPLGDLNGDGSVTIDDVIVRIDGAIVPVEQIDAKKGIITLRTAPELVPVSGEIPTGAVDGRNSRFGLISYPLGDRNGNGRIDPGDVTVTADGVSVKVSRVDTLTGTMVLSSPPVAGGDVRVDYLGNPISVDYLIGRKSGPAVYHNLFKTTFVISFLTTFIALLVGYPVAYLIANVSDKTRSILLPLVIVPFWTSILVRTFAWRIILGRAGFINEVLDWTSLRGVAADIMQGLDKIDFLGIINFPAAFQDGDPLPLVFNRIGTLIGMIHILVPFMIFPIFAVMRGIPNEYVRAAENLGAGPYMAFRRVYFPLTLPGLGAGVLLTFILSLGFFITPALLGGPKDRMVSNMIEEQINRAQNWEFAAALAFMLLFVTIIFYFIYARYMSFEKLYGELR